MGLKDKKLAVLHQISQESEPISLPQLLEKLGDSYNERSVRRWLSKMIKDGLVAKQGEKRGTRYQIIYRSNRNSGATKSCFGLESTKAIDLVRRPLFDRNPVAYSDEWFDSYDPNKSFYIPLSLRSQLYKA
jgi:hypothetical protein